MHVLGTLANGKKVFVIEFIGPSSDITIGAGNIADIDLMLAETSISLIDFASLASIAGFYEGLVFSNIIFTDGYTRAQIRIHNITNRNITIIRGSIRLLAIGIGY